MTDCLKKELRQEYKSRRESISITEKSSFDADICKNIIDSDVFKAANVILIYYPIGSEINISPIAEAALSLGKAVAYPVCDTEKHTLTFKYVSSLTELVVDKYSIPAPPESAQVFSGDRRAMCIVPALSVDKQGFRLGYGGGYYDRFLSGFEGHSVAAVYYSLIADELPRDKYDIPVELIATERGNIIINAEKKEI